MPDRISVEVQAAHDAAARGSEVAGKAAPSTDPAPNGAVCSRLPPHAAIVAACFASHIFTFGPLYAFGVFVPEFKDHFDVELDVATSLVSAKIAMNFIGSLLAGLLIPHRLSHRAVAFLGAVLVTIGYLCASLATSVPQMYAAMGLGVGFGLGACNLAGLTALNARVKENRAWAVGIATCGTSVGSVALPPMCAACIEAFGWRNALRIVGGMSGGVLLAVAPFFVVEDVRRGKGKGEGRPEPRAQAAWRCDLPCAEPAYLCWWLNMLLCFAGYFSPPTLLAQFATRELSIDPSVAATAYTVMGACAFTTRICLGYLTKLFRGPRKLHFASQFANGLLAMLLPFCWNTWSLMLWSAAYGFTVGPVIALISVILSELFGTERLPRNHGFSRLAVGLGSFIGPPVVGRVVVSAGYGAGLGLGGACVCGATGFLLLLHRCHLRRLERQRLAAEGAAAEGSPAKPSEQPQEVLDADAGATDAAAGAKAAAAAAV